MRYHSDRHIHTMISEAVTIGSTRLGNWFQNTYPHECSSNVFHTHNANENNQQTSQNADEIFSESHNLSFIMLEQIIIQEALTSLETFD